MQQRPSLAGRQACGGGGGERQTLMLRLGPCQQFCPFSNTMVA